MKSDAVKNQHGNILPRLSPGALRAGVGLAVACLLLASGHAMPTNAGWNEGFHHPLQGWDHLLTMLAVGIWAAQLRGHAIWLLPLAFVGVMSVGGFAGAVGLAIPSVEGIILLSCAVFGVLIVRKVRFSTQVNVMIVAFFAFFHGFAHGHEISTSASLVSYTLGFMLATLLLHGAGIIVAKLVVLSITCLVAIFFSTLAQATHFDSAATGKNGKRCTQSIGCAEFSSRAAIDQLDVWEISDPSLSLYSETLANDCTDSGRFPCVEAHISNSPDRIMMHSTGGAESTGAALLQAAFHQPAMFLGELEAGWPSVNLGMGIGFKHRYPDINHSPGKNLLSNGVGSTSPPAFIDHLVALAIVQSFRKKPVLLFEASLLQINIAKSFLGISSNQNDVPLKSRPCVIRNHFNTGVTSAACKNNCPHYSITSNLFVCPDVPAVGGFQSLLVSGTRADRPDLNQLRSHRLFITIQPAISEEYHALQK